MEIIGIIISIFIFVGMVYIIHQENKMMVEWARFKKDFFKE